MDSLIQKILEADTNAIANFYKIYSLSIKRFVQRKLKREEDVQELVNDIFLEAIDNLPKLKKHENLKSWLYTIARNKIADYYRKRKVKLILFSQMPFLEIIEKEIKQPEFEFEKNKITVKIETAFHNISKKYRNILLLHYDRNMPIKKVSEKLKISFQAAQSLLFRARQSFKEVYGQEETSPRQDYKRQAKGTKGTRETKGTKVGIHL